MSPHEFDRHRQDFARAAATLGWTRHEYTEQHERDWACSSTVAIWLDAQGRRLFSEADLTEALAKELIRVADELHVGRVLARSHQPRQKCPTPPPTA